MGISPAFGEISKELVERVGSLSLAFHAFHSSVISTAHPGFGFAAVRGWTADRVHASNWCERALELDEFPTISENPVNGLVKCRFSLA